MKSGGLVGYIIFGCVALCVAQAAIAILVLATILALLWGLFCRPAETIGLMCTLGLLNLLATHPLIGVALSGVVLLLASLGARSGAEPDTSSDAPKRLPGPLN